MPCTLKCPIYVTQKLEAILMPTAPRIEYADIDSLFLDPTNPRLGRKTASSELKQTEILDIMEDWTLDELATSFLESGFWPQEALIVVREKLYGKTSLVVVEGNRRLAALKQLQQHYQKGKNVEGRPVPQSLLSEIPYIRVNSRQEVSAYLGFRHVTGIKEWNPAEKAQFIAKLIEEENLTYDEVRKRIGSKVPTVRQNYISYRVLLQMDQRDDIDVGYVENKFSVLYLSLRTAGVQKYLNIDILADPKKAKNPVPKKHLENLANFSRWLFGDEENEPLFSDSRQVDNFGKILESDDAVAYLERTKQPRFELAFRKAGIGEQELLDLIQGASDNIQLALTDAHVHKGSDKLQRAVRRMGADALQLLTLFPTIKKELLAAEEK